jgi:uncharacterized protein YjbJ (UPF0337 family)
MGQEDISAGRIKQLRGKANDIAGAMSGNTRRQVKGKIQRVIGNAQVALGKATTKKSATGR